jgi:hypothetical protein
VDLVELIVSPCCNPAFKTPEDGVGMKSFSSFIMSTKEISKFSSWTVL